MPPSQRCRGGAAKGATATRVDDSYAVSAAALLSTALPFISTHALQIRFLQSIGTTSSVIRGLGQPGLIIRPDSNIRYSV